MNPQEVYPKPTPGFLDIEGEMAALTRTHDWATTSVGGADTWPTSLRITVEMLLHSRFPMFLWWGDDMVQFYNDAYRPSLGNEGKHPLALGQNAKDCWPEIWDIIYPLIKQVKTTGKATWSEDQLIPIYRNGRIEDVYWTFGYSAIKGEEGNIDGVLVVCHETTEKVKAVNAIVQSENRFRSLISEAVIPTALFGGSEFVLELANEAMLSIWGRDESIIGKPLLEFMPEMKNQSFPALLSNVLNTGETYIGQDASVYLMRNGKMEHSYMDFSYKAVKDADQAITGILVVALDVTERVFAKEKLQRSEQNLRNTILKAPVAMCIFRGEAHVVEIANEKMVELWGKTSGDVIGKPIFEGLPEAKDQGFEELLNKVFHKKETISAKEVPVTLPRGEKIETVYVNFVYEPYLDTEGAVVGVLAVAVDVTEQALATRKIYQSEQQVRAIVESAPFPIGVYRGKEMRIELANQSIIDVWGKGGDVVGKLYSEVLPELDNQQIYAQLDSVYTTGISFHARNQRVDLLIDGILQPFYFNYSFTPLHNSDGTIYGVMNTAADVTDLNVAKQRVEQSEQNFRNMVLQAPVAMCIMTGPQHVIEVANKMMIALWGKAERDVMGKPVFEALPDSAAQGLEALIKHVYDTGESFSASERPVRLLRNGNLDTVYQNFVYEPYRDVDGTILGVLAISVDVTNQVLARMKIEEIVAERTNELGEANSNLKKSNAELAQFAYIASHDLQEPLRKIMTFSQMLENALGSHIDNTVRNYLNKINNSSLRMTRLIKDVLSYSELIKEKEVFEAVDLNETIRDVIVDFELLIEQKSASVNIVGLPVVRAIPLQMSQLFSNLIGNSLKFAKTDVSPLVSIVARNMDRSENERLSLLPDINYCHVQVSDNGIGLKHEYHDQIFNIFQRLHRKSEYEGTGIGLAMCKKIALNHQGNINASGSSDNGAVFNIYLPIA